MKKHFLTIVFFILISIPTFSRCIIQCDVRYFSTHEGGVTVESQGIYGLDVFGYSPTINTWSNTYTVDVTFISGYEAIEAGCYDYPENSIIAIIAWNNGGYSVIQIQHWTTQLEVMTEKEVSYDTYGNKIDEVTGIDKHQTLWDLKLNN